jgi:subtilisin family serine protease
MPTEQLNRVGSEPRQYLIAKRDVPFGALGPQAFGSIQSPGGYVAPFSAGGAIDFESIVAHLDTDADITVLRTIAPQTLGLLANTPSSLQRVVVATMPPEKALQVAQLPTVVLEEDSLLALAPVAPPRGLPDTFDPAVLLPFGTSLEFSIRVTGPRGEAIEGAAVYVYGSSMPTQGVTDAKGEVVIGLLNESQPVVRALYVNPKADYWSLWVDGPQLVQDAMNVVPLERLSATYPDLPKKQAIGWGEKAMRLNLLPLEMRGAGVKVAVIDSGIAAGHPDLSHVAKGSDLTVQPADQASWSADDIAHGSHCAGVIGGSDDAFGIRGFAPDAEIHALKIFPGGRFSSLLDALDYCIGNQIDIVNMSLGTAEGSQLVLQKINQAKQQGIACIVAAGNSGDRVQFPGTSPDVLTVAAVGMFGEFPESSFHAQQVWDEGGAPPAQRVAGTIFSAKFTCHGPEVDVAGPGVAVLSSVPSKGFAAWDGTSMAAPHISGLAALVLAHHPDFRGPFQARSGSRVDRLFQLIKESATPLPITDSTRVGVGLPDAPRALGVDQSRPMATPVSPDGDVIRQMLANLQAAMARAGLA